MPQSVNTLYVLCIRATTYNPLHGSHDRSKPERGRGGKTGVNTHVSEQHPLGPDMEPTSPIALEVKHRWEGGWGQGGGGGGWGQGGEGWKYKRGHELGTESGFKKNCFYPHRYPFL